jgi:hypothetical protein
MTPRDPFADLESALSLAPSPEFAARVRARVAEEPRRRAFGSLAWRGVVAAAALAIGVLMMVRLQRAPAAAEIVRTADSETVPATAPATSTSSPAMEALRQSPPHHAPVATVSARAHSGTFEVIVPADQRIALEHLLAAMKAGKAFVPRPATITEVDDDGNRVIAPLPGIVPMKIEPLAGTPADSVNLDGIKKEKK